MNYKARFLCWWNGHDVSRFKYQVMSTKKYHGHDEVRDFLGCARCGAGSPQKELSHWSKDGQGFIRRHELFFEISTFIVGFALVIFAITAGVMIGQNYSCSINGEIMELPWKFNWITGNCYFQFEGRWVARDLLSVVDLLK